MRPTEDNTISPHDVEAGDLLWKYIAELNRANGAEQVNFIARTSVDPSEMAALMPLADALHADLQQNADTPGGEALARARLLTAIQSSGRPLSPWLLLGQACTRLALSTRARDVLLLVGLLLGLGGAIWFVHTRTRPPAYVTPSVVFDNPSKDANCKVPSKKVSDKKIPPK
jgi:hypothetical protein